MNRKVLVTGFFDLLNSGHAAFLKAAAEYGDLYVGIGSDSTFKELKGRAPICSEQERLCMVKAVRHVKDAFINTVYGIWKMLGAGGGGHLLLAVKSIPGGAIPIKIRRRG